jgi:hypothetical protein
MFFDGTQDGGDGGTSPMRLDALGTVSGDVMWTF